MKSISILLLIFGLDLTTHATDDLIEMPDSMKGVRIKMSLSDFLKIHQNVKPFGFDIDGPPAKVDLANGNQLLIEHFAKDSTFSDAMYDFKDNKLVHVVLGIEKNIDDFRKVRSPLILSLIQKWGIQFEKRVVKIPTRINEPATPMLSWNKGGTKITVLCTGDSETSKLKRGILQVNIFEEGSVDQKKSPQEEKVDDITFKKLFESIGVVARDK